jgi:chemotaxis protein CheC
MSLQVDIRKLEIFNKICREGSKRVADSLSQMSGMDAEVEMAKINFLHMDDVKSHLGDRNAVGIQVELTESPYGYVLFILDPQDSKDLAQSMIPGDMGGGDDSGFSSMEKSAIQEIGNIMTSSYIDGWANVLNTTVDMTTPSFTYGSTQKIIDKMGGWPDKEMVFVLDSQITTNDTDLDLTVFTFPQLDSLVELVRRIDIESDIEFHSVADRAATK